MSWLSSVGISLVGSLPWIKPSAGTLTVFLEAASLRIRQSLEGSFSAVSKPNVARKYALESSRRYLHNALLCTVLNAQKFDYKSLNCLPIFSPIFFKFDKFSLDFGQILFGSPNFVRKSEKQKMKMEKENEYDTTRTF